jgi:hypothetical protein
VVRLVLGAVRLVLRVPVPGRPALLRVGWEAPLVVQRLMRQERRRVALGVLERPARNSAHSECWGT